jgi:hypothetical protein
MRPPVSKVLHFVAQAHSPLQTQQKANYALLSPIQAAFVSEIVVVFGEVFCSKFLLGDKNTLAQG